VDLITEFKKVRDIPYRIPLTLEERDDCCSGKAERLYKIFKQEGYKVRYRVCTFRWSDLNLPEEVAVIPHEDECTHTYLEIELSNDWKVIDATWDKDLKKIFHINEWDGKSDTEIAVPSIECLSPEESESYLKVIAVPEAITEDLKKNREFYQSFNDWLEGGRGSFNLKK